jgi:hypothetical protein
MTDERLRRTSELRCPFLDCRSEKVACIGYDNTPASSAKAAQGFDKRLFQCQESERKFLYTGKL